uniref:Uncharacterized protein n=2 Tax=Picea TaxID=3328 RepID=A0A101LW26_PICGL|nr:hypothetical protein ABT39_MTgene1480 [Picea glauca]QHR92671.1 hypothetical protein Q903MT_gene6719 [Picea sitchensis]
MVATETPYSANGGDASIGACAIACFDAYGGAPIYSSIASVPGFYSTPAYASHESISAASHTLRGKQSKVQHVLLKLRMLLSQLAFDPEMVQLQLDLYQVLPLPLLLP